MNTTFSKMFIKTWKNEGVSALFKGATMRICVQAPMFAIMTTAFEIQKRMLASQQRTTFLFMYISMFVIPYNLFILYFFVCLTTTTTNHLI